MLKNAVLAEEIDSEIVAVISAAIAAYSQLTNQRFEIKNIKPVNNSGSLLARSISTWRLSGLYDQMGRQY